MAAQRKAPYGTDVIRLGASWLPRRQVCQRCSYAPSAVLPKGEKEKDRAPRRALNQGGGGAMNAEEAVHAFRFCNEFL